MQAGFLLLEIGFSRQKNVGTGVAKILVNLGVVTLAWWAVGYGISTLTGNKIFGTDGLLLPHRPGDRRRVRWAATDTALMLFGMLFCAVSLAIVWGTTLERIKFSAYVIYAVVFGALIYPLVAHAVYGGGLLVRRRRPARDGLRRLVGGPPHRCGRRAGGAAAARCRGSASTTATGRPRAIPGHSMPLVGLGVADPVGRLVRLQRGLDVRHDGQLHGRGRAQHPAGGRRRRRWRRACSAT